MNISLNIAKLHCPRDSRLLAKSGPTKILFPLTPQYDSAVMYGGFQGVSSIGHTVSLTALRLIAVFFYSEVSAVITFCLLIKVIQSC